MPGLLSPNRSVPFSVYRTFGGASQVTSGNVSFTMPSGNAGQLLLVGGAFRGAPTFSAPSGWTIAQQISYADTTINSQCGSFIAYKIRGASEPTAVFTRTGGNTCSAGFVTGYTANKTGTWLFDTSATNTLVTPSTLVQGNSMNIAGVNSLLYAVMSISNYDPILLTDFQGAGYGPSGFTYLVNGSGENVSTTTWGQCYYSAMGSPNPHATTLGFDIIGAPAGATGTFSGSSSFSALSTMQTMAISYIY